MNKKELSHLVAQTMRENDVRKPIYVPKQTFRITDSEGHSKDFSVRQTERTVMYTEGDVEAVIDALVETVEKALTRGEEVTIRGFGTLGLKYRKKRATKMPGTDEWVAVDARYIPKFAFGNDLRRCAKLYEMSLNEKISHEPLPIFENDEGGD